MKKLIVFLLIATASFGQEIIGPIRIHAAATPYTDVSGQIWASDAAYAQGITALTTAPLATVANATNTGLYQAQRMSFGMGSSCSAFSYVFPVPNNRYRLTLKLADLGTTARTFSAAISGISPTPSI